MRKKKGYKIATSAPPTTDCGSPRSPLSSALQFLLADPSFDAPCRKNEWISYIILQFYNEWDAIIDYYNRCCFLNTPNGV